MGPQTLRNDITETDVYIKNPDDTYQREVRKEDSSLRFVKNEDVIGLFSGSIPLASTRESDSAYLVKIFAKIDAEEFPAATHVAHIGGGMGWLAKMLLGYGYDQDIYEIDADIIDFLEHGILGKKVNFIRGDWETTIIGKYDIIIYDIDEPLVNDKFIKSFLNEGGKLYTLTD